MFQINKCSSNLTPVNLQYKKLYRYKENDTRWKLAFLLATSKSISGVEQKPLKHSHDSMPSPQMTNDRHAGSKGVIAGKDPFGILLTVTTPRLSLKDLKAQ